MNNVITFYSYKGGVGRSMAMANVAVLLAKRGLRVLAVDWDLEAPGLERYFSYFRIEPSGPGLLSLLMDRGRAPGTTYEDYLWRVEDVLDGEPFRLDVLPSGKDADDQYTAKLETFDWDRYFEHGGGEYIEGLRDTWKHDYDVTLIDSRTGLSDSGGVCTIQMPDIVVAMFTANYQSLYGVRDVMRLAQLARNDLAYDRMHLSVLPLPARFGSRSEFRESQEWLDRFAEALGEFYQEWLPTWLEPRRVVEKLKLPQVDYFSFGEKLAIVEQGTTDPDGLGHVYDQVANLLAGELQRVEDVLKFDRPTAESRAAGSSRPATNDGYAHDLYLSYAQEPLFGHWLRRFVQELSRWMPGVRVFFDQAELSLGQSWLAELEDALGRSKLLLPIVTPRYLRSSQWLREWAIFERREAAAGGAVRLIMPIMLDDSGLPNARITARRPVDFSGVSQHTGALSDPDRSLLMTERVADLARRLRQVLPFVPDFDPAWMSQSVQARDQRDELSVDLEALKARLGWQETTRAARKWWEVFEAENSENLERVIQVANELAKREATITECFLAHVSSGTDDVMASLFYLDYTRRKMTAEGEKKPRA